MRTSLQHPLVRDYLVRLDTALLRLPTAQAAELREQLTSHLAEALDPEADDEEVRAVLTDLGEPAAVVAEAPHLSAPPKARRTRTWAAICAVVLVLIGSFLYAERWRRAGSLECDCNLAWADSADRAAKVDTSADGHRQTTVAMRPNATQGIDIQLTNRTGFTQTVLGWAFASAGSAGWQPNPPKPQVLGPFGATSFTMAFSPDGNGSEAFPPQVVADQTPVSIKPGGFRTLSLTWPTAALPCEGAGDTTSIDTISLRVRVGWFTRTEVVALPEAFAMTGPSATCPAGS